MIDNISSFKVIAEFLALYAITCVKSCQIFFRFIFGPHLSCTILFIFSYRSWERTICSSYSTATPFASVLFIAHFCFGISCICWAPAEVVAAPLGVTDSCGFGAYSLLFGGLFIKVTPSALFHLGTYQNVLFIDESCICLGSPEK